MKTLYDVVDVLFETRFKLEQLSRNIEDLYYLCVDLRNELEKEEDL